MAENPGKVTQVYIGFVDILFGVVVGISFAQFVPITLEFKTFTAILAYSTVVASWVGFHKGFKSGSDDYKGPYRFVIDIILLYLYYYLINSFNDFPLMLVILPIIFGFYVLWELRRLIELGIRKESKYRMKWDILFLELFLIQLLVYAYFAELSSLTWFYWVFWIASMSIIIIYRIDALRDWVTKNDSKSSKSLTQS
jgi:hypothetical protein